MAFTTLRVQVNEQTLERLEQAAVAQGRDLEQAARLLLEAAATLLPAAGRCVVVAGQPLDALETILGGGALLSGADLQQKVERLAGISFEHVRLQFTPGQLEEIQRRAERQGKTVEQLVAMMVPRIHEQFFNLIDTRG